MCIQFVCGNLFKKAVEGYRKLNSLELASWFSLLYHLYVNSSCAVMCNSVMFCLGVKLVLFAYMPTPRFLTAVWYSAIAMESMFYHSLT